MVKKLTLDEIVMAYKRWVINNPTLVTDVETVVTWSSYLVAGKINKSPIVSELVYSISKLMCLYNDKLIHGAYNGGMHYYGLQEQIKLWLTVIHYSEVFVELVVKHRWGTRGKWTVTTLIQLFKCSSALILLYRFKEVPIAHPPIPALQRDKFVEGKEVEDESSDSYITLKRSGRVMRRVDGSVPTAFRDWQPVQIKEEKLNSNEIKDIFFAECLHILKPMIHLAAMRVFGTKAWKQWFVALSIDITSMRLYNKHMNNLSYDQRLEVSRRKLSLVLYLLRSPMYNGYSKNAIENLLKSTVGKMPMMEFLCNPIIKYLNHWQDMYFYMWSS